MSQKSVEILLGRILTDEEFRRSFFPVQSKSFELAAAQGLELTPVERRALTRLRPGPFEFLAETLDPRIVRCCLASGSLADGNGPATDIRPGGSES